MFLRAKVHFFSEKPKLSDENCKNYQELSRIIDLSIWQTSDKRIVVSATGIETTKNLPRDDLAGEVFIYGLDDY